MCVCMFQLTVAEDYECNDNVNKVAPCFQGLNRT